MSNLAISKPSKWFSHKSFKLTLPRRSPTSSPVPTCRSKDRLQELQQVFQRFDMDKDGKVSGEELRAFFASIGEEMAAEEAAEAISSLDSDGDRMLDFGDFVAMMERGGEEELKRAFEVFEVVKGSGRITPRGLQQALRRLGDQRSTAQCEAMIRAYDLDGNGELDFHEFQRMMS